MSARVPEAARGLSLADRREAARRVYRESLSAEAPVSGADLGRAFGLSERWGRDRIAEVRDEPAREPAEPVEPPRPADLAGLADLAASPTEVGRSDPVSPPSRARGSVAGSEVDRGSLVRVRWAVRLTLFLGVVASTLANILHARNDPISQTIAAWPPLALLATIELIAHVPVGRRLLAGLRLVAAFTIAGIAAWVSYQHMVEVIRRFGERGAGPYLIPLTVDGLVVVASICLTELTGRIRATDTPQGSRGEDPS